MRQDLSTSRIPYGTMFPGREGSGSMIRAAGSAPVIEEKGETGPPRPQLRGPIGFSSGRAQSCSS